MTIQWIDLFGKDDLRPIFEAKVLEYTDKLETSRRFTPVQREYIIYRMGRIDGLRGIELGEELKKAKIKAQLVYWCNLYLNCVNEPTPANFLSHDQIERAREYSTWELYDGHLIRSGCNFKAKCPFHEERTPSFYFYSDGSYHCFGCSAHGHSAIDYVMKLDKVDFPSAVRRLL